VSPPLRPGEKIFAVDVCQSLVGQVVTVSATPAPAASAVALAFMLGVLALIAFGQLRAGRTANP
jgi:hypothetical protein